VTDDIDPMPVHPDFHTWLDYGLSKGWVSEPNCMTHNGLPSNDEEAAAWDDGFDPCEIGMRVWTDNI
jgi:hypothetical protein